jgi:hypothetical protein
MSSVHRLLSLGQADEPRQTNSPLAFVVQVSLKVQGLLSSHVPGRGAWLQAPV